MTTQEAYEAIREYFSRPEAVLAKAKDECGEELCMYRTPEGNKCAIGCLIPEEVYSPDYENNNIGSLFVEFNNLNKFFAGVDLFFLSGAQSQHDIHASDARDFIKRLDRIAPQYGLNVPADA